MASNGNGSPSPALSGRPSAKSPSFDVTSPVLERVRTSAAYAERRQKLLADIRDGLEDHVRKMEGRARQAVAHASAVAQASRAQEAECLERVERLEDRIRGLQRTKREYAAELRAFQISSEAKREELEKKLDVLRRAVGEAQRQKLLAQEEQQHYERLRDAEKRRYELAEAQLKDFTANVEFRFQEAVASLQAAVQERKRWADEQCALNEKRIREASRRAEQTDVSPFLCRATESAEKSSVMECAASDVAVAVPKFPCDLELGVAVLAASAEARLQQTVEQQDAAEVPLEELPMHACGEGYTSIHTQSSTAAQSASEGNDESSIGGQRDALGTESASHVTRIFSPAEARVKHVLLDGVCATAASASSAPSAKAPARSHEPTTSAKAPHPIAAPASSVESNAPSESPRKELSPTPVPTPSLVPVSALRQSASVILPERKLIDDFSCSTDAFATIFTPRR
ncbi:hypothetical protein GH5_01698 [Leishmania sp. Ghana 2012 LV757]|uniref:hypothetical protein n=1 Tax=Leishmania sp. Ghana 2012 LV757 TaxID=2803181 RepID=UPI001B5EC69B|nr:hypothetical protein GH5_01698 [Leishmania sp. Ghana 2012 LV757]